MAETFDIDIHGLDEFLKKSKALPQQLRRRIATTAARRAMVPVRDDARRRVMRHDDPKTANRIAKNIVISGMNKRYLQRSGENYAVAAGMRVGVKGGAQTYARDKRNRRLGRAGQSYETLGDKKNPGGDTWYWRFLELGTQNQPARPFLRPAMSSNQNKVAAILAREISRELDKLAGGQS